MAKAARLFAVALVSLLFIFWRTSALLQPDSEEAKRELLEGDRICPQVFDGAEHRGADIFIVSTDSLCPYCESVKPFESSLSEWGEGVGIRTIYLITDGPAGESLAERYESSGKSVIRARARTMGVRINPTFVRVSSAGIVKAIWVGGFQDDSQKQLAWDILTKTEIPHLGRFTPAESTAAVGWGATLVRFSRSAPVASNDEFYAENDFVSRGVNELNKRRGVILDCRTASSLFVCQYLARALVQKGFPDVKTVGIPSVRPVCPGSFLFRRGGRSK